MFSCLLNMVYTCIYLHNQNFGATSSGCTVHIFKILLIGILGQKRSRVGCMLVYQSVTEPTLTMNNIARGQNHSFESQVIPRLFPNTLTELSCVSKQIVFRAPMFHSLWESLYLSLLKSMWKTYWRACLKRFF